MIFFAVVTCVLPSWLSYTAAFFAARLITKFRGLDRSNEYKANTMPVEQYIIGDVIGKGSYGEVMLATHKKDKKKYVIKKIDLHNANSKERTFAQQEVEILSKLQHPNIVSYKESYQLEDGCLSIIMGYCEGGDLYARLKKQAKQNEFLEETQVVEWFVQIAMALQYIHDRNILHRDLKTQNIFLTKSKIIKLGDLGIARVLENNADMATTMIGTPYYMSPELFSNKPYNHKSDVWALGCCVYEMATLKHAFNAKDMNSLVYKILKGKMPSMPKHYSVDLLDIIKSMLSYDPLNRPSASRILRHPFIKKHIALFLEGTKTRHKTKSRTEKQPRVRASKTSPVLDISNDVNSAAVATASKVDIEFVEKTESPVESKPMRSDERHVNNDADINANVAEVHKPPTRKSKPDKLKRRDCDVQQGHPETSKSEKILRRRVHDKARLKDEEPSIAKQQQHKNNKTENVERVSSASSQEDHSEKNSRKLSRDKNTKRNHERARRPLPECPLELSEEKPALPRPRFKDNAEEEMHALEINSLDQKYEAQPKISSGVPNMAARKKRRQRQQESQQSQFSSPSLTKQDSQTALSCPSYPRKSKEDIIREHLKRKSLTNVDVVDAPPPVVSSQPSFDESESDEPSSSHGKGSEVMNLIDTLQATLKLDNNTKDRDSPEIDTEIKIYSDGGQQSPSGRLKDRINRLRRECVQGVGVAVMKRAYQIIDQNTEEESEDLLVKLMGREKFNAYNGLIWQLKFCEEFNI